MQCFTIYKCMCSHLLFNCLVKHILFFYFHIGQLGSYGYVCNTGSSGYSDDKLKLTSSEPNFSALFATITKISTRAQGKTICGAILCGKWGKRRVSKNKSYLPYQFSYPLYVFSHTILRLFSFMQQTYILLLDPSFKFVKVKVNKYI